MLLRRLKLFPAQSNGYFGQRRIAAVKMADVINAIEGVPVREYAKQLSASWAEGKLTGEQMKAALWLSHKEMIAFEK